MFWRQSLWFYSGPSSVFRTHSATPLAELVQGQVPGTPSAREGTLAQKPLAGPPSLPSPRPCSPGSHPERPLLRGPGPRTAPLRRAPGGHVRAAPAPGAGRGPWDPRATAARLRAEGRGQGRRTWRPERPPLSPSSRLLRSRGCRRPDVAGRAQEARASERATLL